MPHPISARFLTGLALGLAVSLQAGPAHAMGIQTCPTGAGHLALEATLQPETQTTTDSERLNWQALNTQAVLQADLPLTVLQQAVQAASQEAQGQMIPEALSYSLPAASYTLQAVVQQWPFWDRLNLLLDFPHPDRLRLRLRDNWLPSEILLTRLQERLESALQGLPVTLQRQPDGGSQALVLQVQKQAFSWSSTSSAPRLSLPHFDFQARIADNGSLKLQFQTQSSKSAVGAANGLLLQSQTCLENRGQLEGDLRARLNLDLNSEEVEQIQIGTDKLSERLEAGAGTFDLRGRFSGGFWPLKFKAQGQLRADLSRLRAEGQTYTQIHSLPLDWRYTSPLGLKIWPELAATPSQSQNTPATLPPFSANHLRLFIDGPEYFEQLKKALREARQSIEQEVFSFYDGETTRELARIMSLKAMGLREQRPGELETDPFAPNGVRVFLLHNHKLSRAGAQQVRDIFDRIRAELAAELQAQDLPAEKLLQRLQQNLQITALSRGVVKADHRKMLVIDGQMAYAGGLNLADHYLTQDGFHDLMIEVQGPAVRRMQDEFIENWEALNPGQKRDWQRPSLKQLKLDLTGLETSQMAVLTTDDDSPEQIEDGLLQLINSAQQVIRLEHAYIYDAAIEEALKMAVQRGVKLEIVFSEHSDESLFEILNPVSVLDLMQSVPDQDSGLLKAAQVRAWLYQGKGGQHNYMAHTKYLSVDGKAAIVGSANLIPRSLHALFWSQGKPLLFNEEISLYIRDPKFVSLMDRNLLEYDQKKLSREVNATDLQHLIEQRGGALKVLVDRLKGLLS